MKQFSESTPKINQPQQTTCSLQILTNCGNKCRCECIITESEQDACLSNTRILKYEEVNYSINIFMTNIFFISLL